MKKKVGMRSLVISFGCLLIAMHMQGRRQSSNDALLNQVDAVLREIDAVSNAAVGKASSAASFGATAKKTSQEIAAVKKTAQTIAAQTKEEELVAAQPGKNNTAINKAKKQISATLGEIDKLKETLKVLEGKRKREKLQKLIEVNKDLIGSYQAEVQEYFSLGMTEKAEPVRMTRQKIAEVEEEIAGLDAELEEARREELRMQGIIVEPERAALAGAYVHPFGEYSPFDSSKFKYQFTGYVMADNFIDTRQTFGFREDHLMLFPLQRVEDANGEDINARPQFTMLALQSRLNFKVEGPKVMDANAWAMVEADFWGPWTINNMANNTPIETSAINGFMLRHAFIELDWENTSLLFGQFWHPFYDYNAAVSEDMIRFKAAPFEPINRSPQISLFHKIGSFEVVAAAMEQVDFRNLGPRGLNANYLRNSMIPDVALVTRANVNDHIFGVGVDITALQPRLFTLNTGEDMDLVLTASGDRYKTHERAVGYSGLLYARLFFDPIVIKAKFTYASNFSDQYMLSGFAVEKRDEKYKESDRYVQDADGNIIFDDAGLPTLLPGMTGHETYTPTRCLAFVFDVSAKKEIEPGLSIGYTKNIGSSDCLFEQDYRWITCCNNKEFKKVTDCNERFLIYSFAPNFDAIFGIAPRIRWHKEPITFGAEVNYMRATFGKLDNKGKVDCTVPVDNVRFSFAVYYNF